MKITVFLVLLASAAVIGAGRWWLIVVVVAALAAGTAVSVAAVRGASALARHRLGRAAAVLVASCLRVLVAAGVVAAALAVAGMHVRWLGLILTFGFAEVLLRSPRDAAPTSRQDPAPIIKPRRPGSRGAFRLK